MKTTKFFPILLAAMTLTACSNDETVNEVTSTDRVALQVTSGIQTRAIGNAWQANDAIGIYMLKAGETAIAESATNKCYTTADGNSAFTAATADQVIYFPVSGANVDFIAYYPQQALTDGVMTIDVSSQTNLPKIDLMAAKLQSTPQNPINKNYPAVALNFSHKLTKIELNITAGTGLTAADLAGLKVQITKQRTAATYTPLTEVLALSNTSSQPVELNTATDGLTSSAILLPCGTDASSFNQAITGRELVFTLTSAESFYYAIPDTKTFNAGDRNLYNITINRSGLEVTATIENWNPGNGENGENGSAE